MENIWIVLLLFIYGLIKSVLTESTTVDTEKMNKKYVEKIYPRLKNKYDEIVKDVLSQNYIELSNLVYAIMIVENYNRPFSARVKEYIAFFLLFTKKKMSLGIMQFTTDSFISDKDSVRLGATKIRDDFVEYGEIDATIEQYNNDDDYVTIVNIVKSIIDEISSEISSTEELKNDLTQNPINQLASTISYELTNHDISNLIEMLYENYEDNSITGKIQKILNRKREADWKTCFGECDQCNKGCLDSHKRIYLFSRNSEIETDAEEIIPVSSRDLAEALICYADMTGEPFSENLPFHLEWIRN